MPLRLDLIEVGSRVAYEDMANPRREGRVVEIVKRRLAAPSGLPLPTGLEYRVQWDEPFPHPSRVTTGPAPDYVTGLLDRCPVCPLAEGHEGDHLPAPEHAETVSDLRQHGWHLIADLPGNPFDGADIISAYTRDDAIRDGVLVPVGDLVPDEPEFSREAGWAVPVALTAAAAALVVPTDREAGEYGQDVKGRLWDVLQMARLYGRIRNGREGRAIVYPCVFRLAGPERAHLTRRAASKTLRLKAVIGFADNGEPVLTVMLPHES